MCKNWPGVVIRCIYVYDYRLERPGKFFVRRAAPPQEMIETTRDGSDIIIIVFIVLRSGLACARDDDNDWLSAVGYDANNRSRLAAGWRRAMCFDEAREQMFGHATAGDSCKPNNFVHIYMCVGTYTYKYI